MSSIIFKYTVAFFMLFSTHLALGQEDSESYSNWDEIVSGLESDLKSMPAPSSRAQLTDPYSIEDIHISLGAGLSFTHISVAGDPRVESTGLLRGFGVQFGIDLFHPQFQAEGAFRNYTSDSLSRFVRADLKEFELRLVHSRYFIHATKFRLGAGLSSRYLDISSRANGQTYRRSETTPSAVFLLGLERQFGRNFSVGPDFAYRSPFSSDSLEEGSFDFHIRANAIF